MPKPTNVREPDKEPEWIPHGDLLFDPSNPRLAGYSLGSDQDEVLRTLWRVMAAEEIALSIAQNGYFAHEPLFVEERGGHLVVLEGNRRLTAVRVLLDAELRRELKVDGLPPITPGLSRQLATLPCIASTGKDLWSYVGFKHVHGPQEWSSLSKAEYIARVHDEFGADLSDVARHIGDRHQVVQRLYAGLMVLRQAEEAGVFDRGGGYRKHFAFSHLYTGIAYTNIRAYLGLTDTRALRRNPVPKSRIGHLGSLMRWLYGSAAEGVKPVVESQNPDLLILEEVLGTEDGRRAIEGGRGLDVAHERSKGDSQLFRDALFEAKDWLERAVAKVAGGYAGEPDALQAASSIARNAVGLLDDMERLDTEPQARAPGNGRRRRPTGKGS